MKIVFALIILGVALTALSILHGKVKKLRKEVDQLYTIYSGLTAVAQKHTERLDAIDDFERRFNEVMEEAERQNEREAQWNEGLHNILNYCLEDSFKIGGER